MAVVSSLRWRLFTIAALAQVAVIALTLSAWSGLSRLVSASDAVRAVEDARSAIQDADMLHDALRGDLYRLTGAALAEEDQKKALAALLADSARLRSDLDRASLADPGAAALVSQVRPQFEHYMGLVSQLAALALSDPAQSRASIPSFEQSFRDLGQRNDKLIQDISARADEMRSLEAKTRSRSLWQLLLSGFFSMVGLVLLTHLLCSGIIDQLQSLAQVAKRVISGERDARTNIRGDDEIALLGRAFDEMADGLTDAVSRLEREAERDGFRSRLAEALEMVDEEDGALDVVQRAMSEIAPGMPSEMLLADSSRAHLHRVATSSAGAPGCKVQSPFSCVAVRRGNPAVFPDSEALNACSQLRDRPGGPCSAICVPITFMGRALGVLHSSGPRGQHVSAEQISQLSSLASHAGSRIGTVRAFQKTQLQASTDALTGLVNRRTIESQARQLFTSKIPFTLVLCDLDHFKSLNDTYGHEAGDRALRTFSRVLKGSLAPSDLPARLGGEEFVIVMPNTPERAAIEGVERLRRALHDAPCAGHPRFTASFGLVESSSGSSFASLLSRADAVFLFRASGEIPETPCGPVVGPPPSNACGDMP